MGNGGARHYAGSVLIEVIGGLGLFLLGLNLLVDGLRAAAGSTLRRSLTTLVRGPASGAALGAGVTTLVQSSSATIVATIGFVSAGLMTFPQSLGVILGSNVGTTSTGWLVATLGFKFSIKALALPAVALGAALRLVARGRPASLGLAIAGFGLLFAGIDLLRTGMTGVVDGLGPADLPSGAGWGGRLMLVAAGAVLTVLFQSSSASIAIVLVALEGGGLDFEQATAAVVGANVGTTTTAAIAMVGASPAARRTALAHIGFNLAIGGAAFGLLDRLAGASAWATSGLEATPGPLAVATFHTSINLGGAILLLPATPWIARLLIAVVPQRRDDLLRRLDRSVATVGPVANEALRRTSLAIVARAAAGLRASFDGDDRGARRRLDEVEEGLRGAAAFASRVASGRQGPDEQAEHLATLHILDHAGRLLEAMQDDPRRRIVATSSSLASQRETLARAIAIAVGWAEGGLGEGDADALEAIAAELASLRKSYRTSRLGAGAEGDGEPEQVLADLDASRAIDSAGYQLFRAAQWATGRPSPRGAPRAMVDANGNSRGDDGLPLEGDDASPRARDLAGEDSTTS